MDIGSLGIVGVAAITVLCYFAGKCVKATSLDNKYIPVIVGGCGCILGIVGMFIMPDFPANDYITAAAVGVVSGLGATGLHQAGKQLNKADE